MFLGLFFGELFLLFIFSRMLTSELSFLFFKLFRSRKLSVYLIALLFLPGTLIHELAHATMAFVLLVPVGELELVPKIHGNSLKLGSVQVGRTDIVRNFLIGVAPFFVGTALILATLAFIINFGVLQNIWLLILSGFIVFVIGNTMFSSKKDMEGAIEFIVLLVVALGFLFFLGVDYAALGSKLLGEGKVSQLFEIGSLFLLAPLFIDTLIIGISRFFNTRLYN